MRARPRRAFHPFALAALVAAGGSSAGLARADTPAAAAPSPQDLDAARALFHQAQADEGAGRWGDALDKLHRAIAVKRTPGLLFHIAFCEEHLGKLVAALKDYSSAQDAARSENNREVLGMVSDPILSIKTRVPTITINVPSTSPSEVRIDGELLPPALVGSPVPVDVGSHTVQVTAPGQTPYAITVTLVERQAQSVNVLFVPLAAPAPIAPAPVALVAVDAAPAPSKVPVILATAGSVALLAIGIGAYVAAGSDQSADITTCRGLPSPPCGNATVVRAWDFVALGSWIASAGVAATAVVLWTRTGPADKKAGVELRAAPGWLGLRATF